MVAALPVSFYAAHDCKREADILDSLQGLGEVCALHANVSCCCCDFEQGYTPLHGQLGLLYFLGFTVVGIQGIQELNSTSQL